MVVHRIVAPGTWVRFPVSTPLNADVAQLEEHFAVTEEVAGSGPVICAIFVRKIYKEHLLSDVLLDFSIFDKSRVFRAQYII